MLAFDFNPQSLLVLAGAILSLIFSYIPGVAPWYNALAADAKRLVMLFVLALATTAIYGLACAGVLAGVTCDQTGLLSVISAFISALIANQAVDRVSPKIGLKAAKQ